jgi:hypothetical protein
MLGDGSAGVGNDMAQGKYEEALIQERSNEASLEAC